MPYARPKAFACASIAAACLAVLTPVVLPRPAAAVEGGIGAYLLGSRESLSGVVPPPGFYAGVDVIHANGTVEGVGIGGFPIAADVDLSLDLVKLSLTWSYDTTLFGGTPAINFNIPLIDAGIAFDAVRPPILAGRHVRDEASGPGDIVITPMIGWHHPLWHYSAGVSVFAPTGPYDTASVNLRSRSLDALSTGKNVWSLQPVIAVTYLNTKNGIEVSNALSALFSERNDATDYQSAPAVMLETAVLQHLPSGWAFGVSGYGYGQTADDSGAGAESLKASLGANSLRAQVFGAGPIVTYSGDVMGHATSVKFKYANEFDARRRFESEVFWVNATMRF